MAIDPGTASIIASGISAGGSLLGGALSGGGDLSAAQKWLQAFPVTARVRDARKAGIHPLFALGASTGGGQAYPASADPMGPAIADAAAAIAQGIRPGPPKQKKSGVPAKGSVEESIIAANLASAMRDEAAAIKTNSDRALNVQNALISQDGPTATGFPPSHIQVRDVFTGKLRWIPNTDVGFEMSEAIGNYEMGRGVVQPKPPPPRKYHPEQPKTSKGSYDFRKFPIR